VNNDEPLEFRDFVRAESAKDLVGPVPSDWKPPKIEFMAAQSARPLNRDHTKWFFQADNYKPPRQFMCAFFRNVDSDAESGLCVDVSDERNVGNTDLMQVFQTARKDARNDWN
jgi:hypothetical protein